MRPSRPRKEVLVRLRERLRTMLVCAALQVGVFWGVPMRPEQIQELLFQMQLPTIAHTIPEEDASGGPDGDGRGEPGAGPT
jgi:hypothetical protein